MTARRRARYSREEMQRIVEDRDKHPTLTTLQWAQAYPISTSLYYKFKERLDVKPKAKMGRPPGVKETKPRAVVAKAKPKKGKGTEAEFDHAMGQIKFWRSEATRLATQMITESLTD